MDKHIYKRENIFSVTQAMANVLAQKLFQIFFLTYLFIIDDIC